MVKTEKDSKISNATLDEATTSKSKQKNQGKKRKRRPSSESSNDEMILPDNALETERNVHASALKNNLDETSVRKIIKRVVTNDHVLALVKLREEEEDSSTDDKKLQPKLTRAKAKELKKVSPACRSAAWDLENLELIPIKHIPVKTRPEVKALIAQELPEDEDDEEYEPTHDDVPSDDDHVESCSDLDSQPRTPATPASLHSDSPRVIKDGPFKVPQDVSSVRRKLEIEEEEATIALRTRSKLSLSSTSIEHIESTFVPPDDIPIQDVDDLWNQFLNECLNPASAAKNEDDDETDPEYNVAADPDAHDEDEESLGNSLIKISKKELNDLVTELFSILPEGAEVDIAENLTSSVLTDTSQTEITQWEAKKEPVSDDESEVNPSQRLTFEKGYTQVKPEGTKKQRVDEECGIRIENVRTEKVQVEEVTFPQVVAAKKPCGPRLTISTKNKNIEISIEESDAEHASGPIHEAPPSLRPNIKPKSETVCIEVDSTVTMTPEQILILQQQLRQHVQLATSNFMQTVVHPVHWKLAPTYKEYLASLTKLAEKKEDSIFNVCNLKPAYELAMTWEKSVTEDTEQNRAMIEFVQSEVNRSRRRTANNSLYTGEFHETFKKVVANSPVFLYPYLLPAMPYRPDATRRFCYLHSEDALIVLGLDQFWQYVDSNPQLYKLYRVPMPRARRGLMATVELVAKHMFPWMTTKLLAGHINAVRASADGTNPIYRYFKYNEIPKTEHRILPYNPKITLYEQPEHEIPRIWLRYLAKTSKRFRNYMHKRSNAAGRKPDGIPVKSGLVPDTTIKKPLPIDFTKEIINHRASLNEKPKKPVLNDRYDISIQRLDNPQNPVPTAGNGTNLPLPVKNIFKLVQTKNGTYLIPLQDAQINNAVTSVQNNLPEKPNTYQSGSIEHCSCCVALRKICKVKQSLITDYFKCQSVKKCECNSKSYPKISNRLRLLVRNHKVTSGLTFVEIVKKLRGEGSSPVNNEVLGLDSKDIVHVLTYQLRVFTLASMSSRINVKKRVNNLLAHFDLESGDPIILAMDLFKCYGAELMDLYLDFLTFLTPEQADQMEVFKDYFTRNCAEDLMERVEKEVQDKESRDRILTQLKSVFSAGSATSCEICTGLLATMEGQPKLARYTFHLFPHRKETRRREPQDPLAIGTAKCRDNQNDVKDKNSAELQNTVEYEADQSSCGEESDAMSVDLEQPSTETVKETDNVVIKMEPLPEDPPPTSETINKTEAEEYDSDTSMSIFEADDIKVEENLDWGREQDKLVLQVLQEHLTREERKGESILDLLEKKNVYEMLFESLTDKSLSQIKDRVIYLLTMLVMNEKDS